MKHLIDKDALVAEIERLISNGQVKLQKSQENNDNENYVVWSEHIATCIKVLSFIDTLEVKEVDFPCDENRDKELALSLQIQAYLNTASDELYGNGKPLYSKSHLEGIHECMKMWVKLHNYYFYKHTCENKDVDLEKELETLDSLLYHNAIIKQSAIIDSQPKNTCFPVPKGEEYKHMCMGLAQGYEMDWVDYYAQIMVNEFGEPEHFDSFKKRHPNFAEDIRNAFLNY